MWSKAWHSLPLALDDEDSTDLRQLQNLAGVAIRSQAVGGDAR